MFAFIKLLLGTSDDHKAAEERYEKRVKDLEEREKELDALGKQLNGVSAMQKEKNKNLRKTGIDLTKTLSRSLPPNTPGIELDEDDDERHSEEAIPVG